MSSENAKAVANEVIARVRKGLLVDKGKILKKNGYSPSVCKKPKKVTNTKAYKEVVEPIVERMKRERDRQMKALMEKDLDEVDYEKLTRSFDTFTKNIELLSGRDTERIGGLTIYAPRKDNQDE